MSDKHKNKPKTGNQTLKHTHHDKFWSMFVIWGSMVKNPVLFVGYFKHLLMV